MSYLRAADFALVVARHRWGQCLGMNEGAGIWTIPVRIVQVRGEICRATGVEETSDRTVGEIRSKITHAVGTTGGCRLDDNVVVEGNSKFMAMSGRRGPQLSMLIWERHERIAIVLQIL